MNRMLVFGARLAATAALDYAAFRIVQSGIDALWDRAEESRRRKAEEDVRAGRAMPMITSGARTTVVVDAATGTCRIVD